MDITDDQKRQLIMAELDHEGHAQSVFVLYGDKFKYTMTHGWLRYNGRFWETDGAEQAVERAITNTLVKRRELFATLEEWKKAKLCAGWRQNVTGTKAQFAKMSQIFCSIVEFDKSPAHVNCVNGVLDLRDGELSPHVPSQLFTYCLPVGYYPHLAKHADEWLDFLLSCGLDAEMLDYLRLGLGYSLTGHTSEEIMFYLWGKTRSGKGTLTETANKILGALSTGVDMETFTSKRYGDTSNFDLAPLKAKRFITASESQRHGQLNPAFVKKVTGGDEIYCSFKRRDHFSYRPQFKIWLTSNFEASVDVDDDAAWGRLRIIQFPNSFLGKEDKTLKQRLQSPESLDAIFAWMVSGAIDWYKMRGSGLPLPAAVAEATKTHRDALDSVAQFIEQVCVIDAEAFTVGASLYAEYKRWCDDEGYTAFGRKRFTQSMALKNVTVGVKRVANGTQRGYFGIGLRA